MFIALAAEQLEFSEALHISCKISYSDLPNKRTGTPNYFDISVRGVRSLIGSLFRTGRSQNLYPGAMENLTLPFFKLAKIFTSYVYIYFYKLCIYIYMLCAAIPRETAHA